MLGTTNIKDSTLLGTYIYPKSRTNHSIDKQSEMKCSFSVFVLPRLPDERFGIRLPAMERDFYLLQNIMFASGAHTDSDLVGIRSFFQGEKATWVRDLDR